MTSGGKTIDFVASCGKQPNNHVIYGGMTKHLPDHVASCGKEDDLFNQYSTHLQPSIEYVQPIDRLLSVKH